MDLNDRLIFETDAPVEGDGVSALDGAAGTAGTLLDDGARDETLRRQIYNLLTLRPLIELAANQGRNDALPETLGVLFLTLAALDYISESMGLGLGASPDDTVAHLASICKDMDPALGQERALAAARRVMDDLENRDATGNDRAFRFSYWTASAFDERVFRLVEVHEDRAEAVYVLTPDGLLACLALLDADLLTNVDDLLVERAMKRGRIADALAIAREGVDPFDYDTPADTLYIDVHVACALTGESGMDTVTFAPEVPPCEEGKEHDWRSPFEVVGGRRESPGVFVHGGGVIVREVCAHCACYRVTDTWAERLDTGEQGLTEVAYEDPDDSSLEWLAERSSPASAAWSAGCWLELEGLTARGRLGPAEAVV